MSRRALLSIWWVPGLGCSVIVPVTYRHTCIYTWWIGNKLLIFVAEIFLRLGLIFEKIIGNIFFNLITTQSIRFCKTNQNFQKMILKTSVDDFHPTYMITLQAPQQLFSVLRGPTGTRPVLASWTIAGLVELGTTVTYWEWPVPQTYAPRGTTAPTLLKLSQTRPPLTCVRPASTVPGVLLIPSDVIQVTRNSRIIWDIRRNMEIEIKYW